MAKKDNALQQKAAEDLARSGLTLKDADQLGLSFLSADETVSLGHKQAVESILFPYWDPFTNDFQPLDEFHRVRYLGEPAGFAAQVEKPQRYSQPAGTLNSVYIPRVVCDEVYNWRPFLEDAKNPLVITEGEKKAAAACKAGLPCIGLGGVDTYRSTKRGTNSLPILDQINFRGREVFVVFDTDEEGGLKPSVLRAARKLLDWLLLKGARACLVTLPYNGKKVGLDDWLLEHGPEDFWVLATTEGLKHDDAIELSKAAEQYRYIVELDRFVDEDSLLILQPQHLNRVLGLKQVTMPRLTLGKESDGSPVTRMIPKPVDIADALVIWPGAEKFGSMVYRPGQGRIILEHGKPHLNLWAGWRAEYEGLDTLPSSSRREQILKEWFWAIDNVFSDDPVAREYVEHWLFYPMKYAGTKINTFSLICSRQEGIGKSFIGHMIAKHIYGLTKPGAHHAWQLAEGDLAGSFNPFMFATSFVEGDDIAASDKVSAYKRIQSFTTADTVNINIKNLSQFMMNNCANFWLTSNDAAPFYLHEMSRRAFVHIPQTAKKNPERYHALQQMFDSGEAGPTLLWYARNKYDEQNFSPVADAPMTQGKKEIALNSRSGLKEWVFDLIANARFLTRPFATTREISALLDQDGKVSIKSSDSLGHFLRDAGATRWGNGAQISIAGMDGSVHRERVWIFDEHEKYEHAKSSEIETELKEVPFGFIRTKVTSGKKY